jgi:signal transduction histidine kinase/ActR/RegA family two-component response regulator
LASLKRLEADAAAIWPSASYDRLRRRVALAAVMFGLALVTIQAFQTWHGYRSAREEADARAANLVYILSAHMQQSLAALDASLVQIAVANRRLGGPNGNSSDWQAVLTGAAAGLPIGPSLSITDSDGVIRHSTIPQIIGQSRRNLYMFQALSRQSEAGLVADKPFRSRTRRGTMLIPLGRRLESPDGSFQGAVVVTLRLEQLRDFYRSIDVGRGGSIRILHTEGKVLFREPSVRNPIDTPAFSDPVYLAYHRGLHDGRLEERIDGRTKITAFHALPSPGMLVAVSLDRDAELTGWRSDLAVQGGLLAAELMVLMAATLMIMRLLKARQLAERQLIQSQKMEGLGQLTGGVAHDFNNLLTVISLNLDELADRTDIDPEAREMAQAALKAADRGADLVRSLLAFARKQPLRPRVIDVNEIARDTDHLLQRTLGDQVELVTILGNEVWPVSVDPAQLQAALVNLAVNARDAMPRGGKLTLETSNISLDEHYAKQNADVRPGDYALVAVSDTGSGIPAVMLDHVFEPFFTTKEVGKGTGLGLSMIYGFVKQSSGHIKIYSEVGQGTTVKLYLPRSAAIVESVEPAAVIESKPPCGEAILVVEDDLMVREFVVRQLERLGYLTFAAGNGTEALAVIDRGEPIHLMLTDVMMPGGMTGKQLALEAERRRPGLKVLYMSGYTENAILHHGRLDPDVALLSKPFRAADLERVVRETIAGDAP